MELDQNSSGADGPLHRHGGCISPSEGKKVNRKLAAYCQCCGTKTILQEQFGKTLPTCPNCGWIGFQDPKVAAATLIEKDGRFLLTRRLNEPGQGLWSLPAGFIDADEDPAAAAARECFEETGLEVKITALLDVIPARENGRGADILILYRAEITGGVLAAGDDAGEVGFFSRSDLPELAFKSTRIALGLEGGNFFHT